MKFDFLLGEGEYSYLTNHHNVKYFQPESLGQQWPRALGA